MNNKVTIDYNQADQAIKAIARYYNQQDQLNKKLRDLQIKAEGAVFNLNERKEISPIDQPILEAFFRASDALEVKIFSQRELKDISIKRVKSQLDWLWERISQDLPQLVGANKVPIEGELKKLMVHKKSIQLAEIKSVLTKNNLDIFQPGAEEAIQLMVFTLGRRQKALKNSYEILAKINQLKMSLQEKVKIDSLQNWLKQVDEILKQLCLDTQPYLTKQTIERLNKLGLDNLISLKLLSKKQLVYFLFELELAGWSLLESRKGLTKSDQKSK